MHAVFQILDVVPCGPCARTSIQTGDILVEIDGFSLTGKSITDIVDYTMGNEGSEANLVVTRGMWVPCQVLIHFLNVDSRLKTCNQATNVSTRRLSGDICQVMIQTHAPHAPWLIEKTN
jgi:C-terminal processing protease CtpA/Prc